MRLLLDDVLREQFLTKLHVGDQFLHVGAFDLAGERGGLVGVLALAHVVDGLLLKLVKLVIIFRDELLPMAISLIVFRVHVN